MIEAIKEWIFSDQEEPEPKDVEIVEGASGTWTYHLKRPEDRKALCGKRTMKTSVTGWGSKNPRNRIPTSYCEECERIAAKQNLNL